MNEPSFLQLGLIGWPVGHSLSPVIHEAALKACGLKGEYKLFPVKDIPEGKKGLEGILQGMRSGEIHGLNVTVPHKINVISLLDSLSPNAQEIGAVNTIFLEKGKLIGDNTDKDGFLIDLKQNFKLDAKEKTALVLGAGGSSRAVIYALAKDGWQVNVAARREEQAQSLAADFYENHGIEIAPSHLGFEVLNNLQIALIVNTTPVGMAPSLSVSPWPLETPFPEGCFIYDLVYNPSETVLVKQSRSAGLRASNGIGMLIEQAALAFEIWSGTRAPRPAMLDAVSKHLEMVPPTTGG